MKFRFGVVVSTGTAAILAAAGCTADKAFLQSGVAAPASVQDADAHTKATEIKDQTRDETRNLTGEKFRVKDSELLRGTLNCVGDNVAALLTVTADAIRSNQPATAGKLRILPNGSVAVGTNIIDAKKADLFDPAAEGRESAASPEATASYLNAATMVAEIVAHNADVSTPTSKAYCRSSEAATALIKRCVPTIEQEQLNLVIDGKTIPEKMAAECDKGTTAIEKNLNSRVALASFLGSWLFLKSER